MQIKKINEYDGLVMTEYTDGRVIFANKDGSPVGYVRCYPENKGTIKGVERMKKAGYSEKGGHTK